MQRASIEHASIMLGLTRNAQQKRRVTFLYEQRHTGSGHSTHIGEPAQHRQIEWTNTDSACHTFSLFADLPPTHP
eukprot:6202386-Pleurochrysis_carterae.AAC.1